ncbi:phospholipase D-like domain-containing protein [Roseateles sp. SL47]|uniref:phospholipase D-like domain-containing protein n=1 Tax=Roseateles sp. SL47 TaxID=2995138 RepID=UPI0022711D50|nr:phospholipase D-like domain-containing protein [Roseateles sp. SL47]WAC71796.1 phospholipase D-like domain-containing protein [Roseateles sp. SL47]
MTSTCPPSRSTPTDRPKPTPKRWWSWKRGALSIHPATLLVSLCAAVGMAACATPAPPMQGPLPEPPASTPSAAQVARQVDVVGAKGVLGPQRREQVIQTAAAQGSADLLKRHLAAMAGVGDVDLFANNDARLLIDGPATFEAMFATIQKARRQILLESYIIEDAEVARKLAELLIQRRQQGVKVAVIYDAIGSLSTQEAYFDRMRQAGIAICAFNPVNPLKSRRYHDITERDHRKILVVDNDVGFTGGINISAVYSSGSGSFGGGSFGGGKSRKKLADASKEEQQRGWRDTMIQVRGPAVQALHDMVLQTWKQQACEGALEALPPPPGGAGQQLMRIVPSTPQDKENRIYTLLLGSIRAAQRSVYLTMAYFAPGQDMVDALTAAAERGVDVQLILPSKSDFSPVMHAGRSHYERLLKSGVKIHELQDAVLHAKTAVIDGVVSTVGSSNMDWRSFVHNNEVNAVVLGEDFGSAMTVMFLKDRSASRTIDLDTWKHRPLLQRGKEYFSSLLEHWW